MRALAVALVIAGCADNGLHFADLEDGTIDRIVATSVGGDAWLALGIIERVVADGSGCPDVQVNDGITSVTGDCVRTDGTAVHGRLRVVGPVYPREASTSSFEFEDFAVRGRLADGRVHVVGDPFMNEWRLTTELILEDNGRTVVSNLEMRCRDRVAPSWVPPIETIRDPRAPCDVTAQLEVAGSVAHVAGQVGGRFAASGRWTVSGEDSLEVNAEGLGHCIEWQIAGTDRIGGLSCAR